VKTTLTPKQAFDRWLEKETEVQRSGKQIEGPKRFLSLMFDWKSSIGEIFNAEEIFEDSFNYMTAGMDGNGHVLAFVTWSITNPDVKAKLEKELLSTTL
jgi:cytochrome P450